MWEFLYQMFKNPIFWLAWGLIGFLIVNRLVIGRDKRREFNEIIEPIRTILTREINNPSPYTTGLNKIDIFNLRKALPFWKRRRFDNAIKKYEQSKSDNNIERNEYGEVSFKNTEIVIHAANKLLKFAKKR